MSINRNSDLTLILIDGSEINVVYPNAIGVEYDTPYLDNPKCREWWASFDDAYECLCQINPSNNPCFVMSKWGTEYKEEAILIPFEKFLRVRDLTPELQVISDEVRAKEKEVAENERRRLRLIKGEDFDALLERIEKLEKALLQKT